MENWYKYLGIENFSDIEAVKRAYRNLSRKYHPDNFINSSDDEKKKNEKAQQKLNEIWQNLSDESKKNAYDEKLKYELDCQKYSKYSSKPNQRQGKTYPSQQSRRRDFSSQQYQRRFFSSYEEQNGFFSSKEQPSEFFTSYQSFSSHQERSNKTDEKSVDDKVETTNLRELLLKKNSLKNEYIQKKSKVIKKIIESEEYKKMKLECDQLNDIIYSLQLKKDELGNQISNLSPQEVINNESLFRRLFNKLFRRKKQLNQTLSTEKKLNEELNEVLGEIDRRKKEQEKLEKKLKQFLSDDILNQNIELSTIIAKINEIDIQIEKYEDKSKSEQTFTASRRNK